METGIGWFNGLPDDQAWQVINGCCGVAGFVDAVLVGRPYDTRAALLDAANAGLASLSDAEVDAAVAAHPRIGAAADGLSAEEQAGATAASDEIRATLAAGNEAYESRFGRRYLVCATGMSGADLLETLTARLDNDATTEREVTRAELTKITTLRVKRMLAEAP